MNLRHEIFVSQERVEDVIHVDGQDVQKTTTACRVDGVTGVIWKQSRLNVFKCKSSLGNIFED